MSTTMQDPKFAPFLEKMKADKLSDSAISAFANAYAELTSGESGMILESQIKVN